LKCSGPLNGSWLGAYRPKGHQKHDGSTEEFIEMACDPYDSVCGEKFPYRLISKKNFSIISILRSIVSLENIGVISHFSEAAPFCLVKAPLGKFMRPDVIPGTPEVGKDSTGEDNSAGEDNSTGDIEVMGDFSEAATFIPQKLPQSGLFHLGFEIAKILTKILPQFGRF
jgi:hypothetical protein